MSHVSETSIFATILILIDYNNLIINIYKRTRKKIINDSRRLENLLSSENFLKWLNIYQ